jgi:hypothetical protein
MYTTTHLLGLMLKRGGGLHAALLLGFVAHAGSEIKAPSILHCLINVVPNKHGSYKYYRG